MSKSHAILESCQHVVVVLPGGIFRGSHLASLVVLVVLPQQCRGAIAGSLILCQSRMCHGIVFCCRGLTSLSTAPPPSPRLDGPIQTTYMGSSIPGEQLVQFKVLL